MSKRHEISIRGGLEWPEYVVISDQPYEASVELKVYEVVGRDGLEPGMPLLFHSEGWTSSPGDSTTDMAKAEVYVEGFIKWDGCSDWTFGGVGHFCGRSGAVQLGTLMDRLYSLALELMGPGRVHDVDMFNGT